MERVAAAVAGFLGDADAVAAALEVDRQRERSLGELSEAFTAFRDSDEPIQRLATRIGSHLRRTWQPAGGPPQNLWGFRNEEESRFLERFNAAGSRVPDVDLGALLRTHLEEPENDEERIQVLLAFAEFVAGMDHSGHGAGDRLGVGPAAHFLTFAWHCLSRGREPVFTWAGDRGVRAMLGPNAPTAREWEPRIRAFYDLAREVVRTTAARPPSMRDGWAVEHVLAWSVASAEDPARPTIVPATRRQASVAREPAPVEAEPPIRAPGSEVAKLERISQITRKSKSVQVEAAPLRGSGGKLEDAFSEQQRREHARELTEKTDEEISSERAELEARSKKRVKVVDADPLPVTGMALEDALPADRTPAAARPRPEPAKKPSRPDPLDVFVTVHEPPRSEPRKTDSGQFKTAAQIQREMRDKAEARRASEIGEVERTPATAAPRPASPRPPARTPVAPLPRVVSATETPPTAIPRPAGRDPLSDVGSSAEDHDSDTGLPIDSLVSELRGEVVVAERGGATGTVPPDRLARDLLLEPALTGELLAALEERGRLLLVGPPATGKTHVARRLAIHTAGHIDRVVFLRVHPELRYQALIEGSGGHPGVVRELCERARREKDQRWALVLDELDRGDAARCLGDFLGALSERGKGALLSSGVELVVPRNLVVIATAREEPLDPALVGRFPIVWLQADAAVLRRFLSQVRPTCEWVADLVQSLNQRLAGQGHALRIGHGLFMDPDLDPSRLRRTWGREVLPLLRAHGVPTAGLEYDALRPRGG